MIKCMCTCCVYIFEYVYIWVYKLVNVEHICVYVCMHTTHTPKFQNENVPNQYKPNEWMKLERIVHASFGCTYPNQSTIWCNRIRQHTRKKVAATKIFLVWPLYNLWMKESNSVQAHLNEYESISSQISTIDDELKALLLMSNLPPSCETFITTVCNTLTSVIKYSEMTSSILSKDA